MKFDIQAYIDDAFPGATSSGDERCDACPECGKPGHWYINVDTGSHVCFKCDFRGRGFAGIVKVVAIVEGLDEAGAARYILQKSGVNVKRKKEIRQLAKEVEAIRTEAPKEDDDVVEAPLPDEFVPVWNGKRWSFPSYLKERGITKATAAARGLGYCTKGRYANRVIIPVDCPNGRGFTARYIGDHPIRYLNPKGVDFGRLLFGWSPVTAEGDVTLVEGPLDELMMYQHGIPALGLGGKALKADQLELLCRRPPTCAITIMLDPEEETAPAIVARQLLCHFNMVYIAKLPIGVDPGSSTKEQAAAAQEAATRFRGELTAITSAKLSAFRARLEKIYQ